MDSPVTKTTNLIVTAAATDSSTASATAVAGGIFSGAGAEADSFTAPTVSAYVGNVDIKVANAVQISATATPTADSTVVGVAAGGLAVGASIANATSAPAVSAYIGGSASTVTAMTLSVAASMAVPSNASSTNAQATGSAGGVLLGVDATTSTATNSGTVNSYESAARPC